MVETLRKSEFFSASHICKKEISSKIANGRLPLLVVLKHYFPKLQSEHRQRNKSIKKMTKGRRKSGKRRNDELTEQEDAKCNNPIQGKPNLYSFD
eukprot:snap_masked-scaffold_53-processed-gene-0.30-mRNA-1 protein AED:1.00 eAED:1.00 QI:0/-1/0/0/-1/1/1/0/94